MSILKMYNTFENTVSTVSTHRELDIWIILCSCVYDLYNIHATYCVVKIS